MNYPAASRGVSVLKQLELLLMKLFIFRFITLIQHIFLNQGYAKIAHFQNVQSI